jgi:GAF domain-containing protein
MGAILRPDRDLLRFAAGYEHSGEFMRFMQQHPIPLARGTATGRALLERTVVHIPDVGTDPEYTFAGPSLGNFRTIVAVPMLREGTAIGVLALMRNAVRPIQRQADRAHFRLRRPIKCGCSDIGAACRRRSFYSAANRAAILST